MAAPGAPPDMAGAFSVLNMTLADVEQQLGGGAQLQSMNLVSRGSGGHAAPAAGAAVPGASTGTCRSRRKRGWPSPAVAGRAAAVGSFARPLSSRGAP